MIMNAYSSLSKTTEGNKGDLSPCIDLRKLGLMKKGLKSILLFLALWIF